MTKLIGNLLLGVEPTVTKLLCCAETCTEHVSQLSHIEQQSDRIRGQKQMKLRHVNPQIKGRAVSKGVSSVASSVLSDSDKGEKSSFGIISL